MQRHVVKATQPAGEKLAKLLMKEESSHRGPRPETKASPDFEDTSLWQREGMLNRAQPLKLLRRDDDHPSQRASEVLPKKLSRRESW